MAHPTATPGDFSKLLDDLEAVFKDPTVGAALGARGVNVSLVLVAIQGLEAYLRGETTQAVEDFETVAEEIRARAARRDSERAPDN